MSVLGSIMSAVFGSHKTAAPSTTSGSAAAPAATGGHASPTPSAGGTGTGTAPQAGGPAAAQKPAAGSAPPAAAPTPMTRQQVEAMIQAIADKQGHKDYSWKESIVDLMKLLNLDSSLHARKQLAQELGYTGAPDGSAEMNVWLHKQVMARMMESGGVVPNSLK